MNLATDIDTSGSFPFDCNAFGAGVFTERGYKRIQRCMNDFQNCEALLVLAGSRTAEVKGISAAGATSESRRYTAIAHAELLLNGPF